MEKCKGIRYSITVFRHEQCGINVSNPNGGGKREVRPIPPPFPNGKGAGRLMVGTVFLVSVLFEEGLRFSPLGETGEGFGLDLTQMETINRRVGLPLSKWRGHGLDFFSWLMVVTVFPRQFFVRGRSGLLPIWGDGRGVCLFCITIPLCQSKISSQVKRSPKKNFNAPKNCGAR
jgi:hypothetical protein